MNQFELYQLRYFVSAAETGSFTAAAKALYVSQQTLSYGIKALETVAGAALFRRGRLGVELTDLGKAVYDQAKRVTCGADAIERTFESWQAGMSGSFSVGVHPLCFQRNGGTLASKTLLAFKEAHPNVDCSFSEMENDSIQSGIENDRLDFGIGLQSSEKVESRLLYAFPMSAVMSAEFVDEMFPGKECLTTSDLALGKLITFSDDFKFNDYYLRAAEQNNDLIETSPVRTSAGNTVEDALAGYGTYIIKPLQHARRTIDDPRVRIMPVVDKDGKPVLIPLRIFWRKDKVLTGAEEIFVNYVAECYRNAKHV